MPRSSTAAVVGEHRRQRQYQLESDRRSNHAGDASLSILNDGGTIGADAVINVTAANITGLLRTGSLLCRDRQQQRRQHRWAAPALYHFNVGGDLTTQGDATFQILNFDDDGGPGTIGVDAVINVTANNISTGGALEAADHKFWRHHRRECHGQRDCSQHYHRRLL